MKKKIQKNTWIEKIIQTKIRKSNKYNKHIKIHVHKNKLNENTWIEKNTHIHIKIHVYQNETKRIEKKKKKQIKIHELKKYNKQKYTNTNRKKTKLHEPKKQYKQK